ncbi:3,4-dihydroxy-2-butanone-4-phosphate synthase [Agrobacterium tumefaciens]|uniref:3,4-dihydroxy-2-butanone 4-phosphate synthase n=1 Tax=Agrobacterium tumefaciens TaxID=358 RepID=A0A2L2LMS6_AGRTU|nr:3,4-dihydroxy-2-butanone-4-phosphate synthase [Agrobacterium tumefaciens]AVH45634.1 3,4-dihydroxy 2-butanone 4-phosphate synthase [Agrobacterium tumefaciens]NSY99294.1 3,4-dihydroxy-2-butanone-4-phosphate synthase [Agrobacterium tumefaciens]
MAISEIEDALKALAHGRMILVADDEDRENEGDVIAASQFVTAETIAFMMRNGRGLICVAMEGARLDELNIPLMVPSNTDFYQTAFTVSVDLFENTTTGISANDRAATVQALLDPISRPEHFSRPGHVFPLRAHPKGVLARAGHTEAAVDLCRLAGLKPSGVICEVAKDDGTMARLPDLIEFAKLHHMPLVTISDLISYIQKSGVDNDQLAQTMSHCC